MYTNAAAKCYVTITFMTIFITQFLKYRTEIIYSRRVSLPPILIARLEETGKSGSRSERIQNAYS